MRVLSVLIGIWLEMADLDFIPPLPAGPLDPFRKLASFDWRKLKVALEDSPRWLKIKVSIFYLSTFIYAPDQHTNFITFFKKKKLVQIILNVKLNIIIPQLYTNIQFLSYTK